MMGLLWEHTAIIFRVAILRRCSDRPSSHYNWTCFRVFDTFCGARRFTHTRAPVLSIYAEELLAVQFPGDAAS